MATLLNLRINFGTKESPDYKPLTIRISDELDKFGYQVQAWHQQSEREQKEKAPRVFVGNGKVTWTDGKIDTSKNIELRKEKEDYENL